MFHWVRMCLHRILSCQETFSNRLPEQILYVILVQVWHTSLSHGLLSAKVCSQVEEAAQKIGQGLACCANKMVSHPHQNLRASERFSFVFAAGV